MQEQHPYKVTPDQAWDKMKFILDEHMPENPSARRYPIVWWSVSAVVIAALMGILVFNEKPVSLKQQESSTQSEATSNVPETQVNEPVVNQSQVPATSQEIHTTTNDIHGQHEKGSSKNQTTTTTIENKKGNLPAQVIKPSSKSEKATQAEKSVPMAMTTTQESFEPVVESVAITEVELAIIANQYEVNEEELSTGIVMIYEEKYRDARVTEPLSDDNLIAGITSDLNEEIITGKALKNKVKTPFFEPNIAVSGLAGVNGGLGLYGGAGVNMNVSNRFSVTTSVGYLSYNPNSFLTDYLEALDGNAEYNTIVNYDPAIIGNETYVDAGNVNNHAGYNAINPLVDRVSQWQVSTGVKWKVSPRFFSELGVQFGLHTQAFSEYPIVDFGLGTSMPSLRINNSLDEYDVIRSSTTSLYLGVGYRVGKHFDVFSNWNHGLHQYILNDETNASAESDGEDRTDYIRGLSLGLRYTL